MVVIIVEWHERDLVEDEGGFMGHSDDKSLEECKKWCGDTDGCNSFSWSKTFGCFLKDKCLTADEPSKINQDFVSYYRPCSESGKRIRAQSQD